MRAEADKDGKRTGGNVSYLSEALVLCDAVGFAVSSGRVRRLRVVGHCESDKLGAGGRLEPRFAAVGAFLQSPKMPLVLRSRISALSTALVSCRR